MKAKFANNILCNAMLAIPIYLSGCGGSGSDIEVAVDQPESHSSKGMITGFGSIYVDGIKFESDDSDINLDDESDEESEHRKTINCY